ncbi:acyl-CoA dehydrogenase [Clostridium botulinum]|uniref:Butyryl-CoA dehydrogenase n=1 Tax=Clostridium botulinum (strain Langeland / NCTC 10281 / Type F) TaxID=441772 RepID=A7GIE0_CLOBL|nr:acyl-CoA dehydrogenase [Clostridium botulinum]ABS40178.1 butyryl-CoA dehydrogenase [Clostridium botulinum F str. Langeland]ADG00914.1 butyryl-CoA dehydrogenase [Clostridium botulinum F str. 230613]KKM41853.1 acyl-CoA dehydrogenase [Clostridium botulinum]MBY6794517.1 acyl-CoA dehydrogenase [Clostridium botulinum]MBY6938592.1 acyl-CoA dehydrogenase [Clostridium botulinum]
MEFGLSQEQKLVKQMLMEFVENEVEPIAADIDKTERYPIETVEKMAKYGIMGMPFPKEYGGAGTDYLSYVIAVEELAKECATTSVILSAHTSLCCAPIFEFGTEEQKKKYLPDLLSGKKIGAFGLTEPNAGTDASAQQSVAVLEGDHYILNGSKIFITNGGAADTFVIFAMTDRSKGVKGISAFILEKEMSGFSIGKTEDKMGIRASSTTELIFEDVKVPKENLLGKEGKGFGIAMKTLDGGRIGIAAQALGIAEGALDHAVAYMKERKQFGKNLTKFQGLQWYIADMKVRVDAAKYLVYKAAWKKSAGENYTMDAAEAKLYAAEVAMYVTNKSLQILGGYGYTKDYPLERMLRDARITEIYEGTSEVQKMVIASSLLH